MSDVNELVRRIDAEFDAAEKNIKEFQAQQIQQYHDRQQRLEQFSETVEGLKDVWRPHLEALKQRFGDRVQVQPQLTPGRRQATFEFQSNLARISLKFTVSTDSEVRKVIFSYDLDIIPILMKFDSHEELEFPLGAVDQKALAQWIEDRIVDFVRTYLSLHQNQYYLKQHMVEDPVAKVRFPSYAAGATLERGGKTYYFISEETRREFEKQV
jgi:YHS domain-containing protein